METCLMAHAQGQTAPLADNDTDQLASCNDLPQFDHASHGTAQQISDKSSGYGPDDVVDIVDGFRPATAQNAESSADTSSQKGSNAQPASWKKFSRLKRTLIILEQMMAVKNDKNSLPSISNMIRTALEEWNFNPSLSEIYEARAEYVAHHPGVIIEEEHKRETPQGASSKESSQQHCSLNRQSNPLFCTVEYGGFRVSFQGSQQSDLKQLLPTIFKTLRDCYD